MIIDLHVHTAYSDDFELNLGETIEKLQQRGVGGLVLAECDFVPDLDEVKATATEAGFNVFVGAEVEANQGRFIAIPTDPNQDQFKECAWLPEEGLPDLNDVITFFNELGGVVIAVHPYLDDGEAFLGDEVYNVEGLAAVETLCGVRGHFPNDRALEAAASLGLPNVGGSDTGPKGERLGHFATAFADDIQDQAQLVEAIRNGDAWAVEIRPSDMNRGGRGRGRGSGRGRDRDRRDDRR